MSDIVERLRDAPGNHDALRHGWIALVEEASDEIARLRARIAELERAMKRRDEECYKKCGICEFDYGRCAPKEGVK